MWTPESLQELVGAKLGGHQLVVVANREPYLHRWSGNRIECVPPVGGVVSALDPILRASGGVWVAHGSGDADRKTADSAGRIRVPPADPRYLLRRVWLSKAEVEGYYHGLANSGLWPLCHRVFTRPEFHPEHWPVYRKVNELFANAVVEEANGHPAFVFVQDYHFGLLPRIMKERNPNLIIAQFWHIPWPNSDVIQVFPWKEELLDGLLGNDVLGFHLRSHCQSFLETIDRTLEAKVDWEEFSVTRGGKTTLVRPFPISIDFQEHERKAISAETDQQMDRWRQEFRLGDGAVGIGIDRIDYTKGIPERLRALDLLFTRHPEHRERLTFVQIGVPSRTHVQQYKNLDDEIDTLVERLNWKWGTESWTPCIYLKRQHGSIEMMALHRLANFCVVSALNDGMNLVSKEFVASRFDEDGVLILSQFAGASKELTDAVLINPFAVDELANAMQLALEMPLEERRKRMQKMRAIVAENNIYRWAGKILSTLFKLEFREG